LCRGHKSTFFIDAKIGIGYQLKTLISHLETKAMSNASVLATATGTPNALHRRALLTAAAALPVAGGMAVAGSDQPILGYYREWKKAYDDWDVATDKPEGRNCDSPEVNEAQDRRDKWSKLICHTTPTTPAEIAAMIQFAVIDWEDWLLDFMTDKSDAALFGNILKGAEMM
jgi:hypothetical protein